MSIGVRLKEERLRLGLSQAEFAALAGAKQGAQLKWEKDQSSPTATALAAWADAGADVPYILGGRRLAERRADTLQDISEQLAQYKRELIDPEFGSDVEGKIRALSVLLVADAKLLTPEQRKEAEQLLEIAKDEAKLRELRATEAIKLRQRKEQMKRRLASSLEGIQPSPGETVAYLLLQLAVDHGVPTRTLADLWEQIQLDAADRRDA